MTVPRIRRRLLTLALALALLPAPAGAGPWDVPAPDACTPAGGLRSLPDADALPPLPFKPGDVIDFGQSEVLKAYVPEEVWTHRDKFFFEGMRMEVGPCFRDYSPPAFYRDATQQLAGQPALAGDGGLEGYTAGRPFPPDAIAADDPQAGLKWAWNTEFRYQGAGFGGKFRIMDMVGRTHRGEAFEGEIFKWLMNFRADRAEDGYKADNARSYQWISGGLFTGPFNAREYAWRQYRHVKMLTEPGRTDDLHAYLPQFRRVRRMSAVAVEGLYMPSFSVGVVPNQQLAVAGGGSDAGGSGGGLGATGAGGTSGGLGGVGGSPAVSDSITPKRNGFEGLELRPLLYGWRVVGVRDVLAPLNAKNPAYPVDPDRAFGPWGLSFASDRWDLRRALVLEGTAKKLEGDAEAAKIRHFLDLQTLQPLYYMSWDRKGEIIDVGVFVGRWSEDREGYRPWPDAPDRPVRVLDPAGAAFANIRDDGGWRRESWEVQSTPPDDAELRRQLSVGELTKRR